MFENGFDKDNIGKMRELIEENLKKINDMYGVAIKAGKITYSSEGFKVTLDGLVNADGQGFEKQNFDIYCMKYGLSPDDFGKEFTTEKGVYVISGIKPNNRKYPVIAKSLETGKSFKFMATVVRNFLKREEEV